MIKQKRSGAGYLSPDSLKCGVLGRDHLTFPSISFLIYRMGVIVEPADTVVRRGGYSHVCETLVRFRLLVNTGPGMPRALHLFPH